jgi:hypothetical protein
MFIAGPRNVLNVKPMNRSLGSYCESWYLGGYRLPGRTTIRDVPKAYANLTVLVNIVFCLVPKENQSIIRF